MKTVKLSDGQDIVSKNLIQDIVIGDNGEVTMEISFDKNFKQTKKLIMKSLQEIPWVTKVEVKMAVEVNSAFIPLAELGGWVFGRRLPSSLRKTMK